MDTMENREVWRLKCRADASANLTEKRAMKKQEEEHGPAKTLLVIKKVFLSFFYRIAIVDLYNSSNGLQQTTTFIQARINLFHCVLQ